MPMNIIDRLGMPESCYGFKLDSILAYTTPRFVRIEDRRLGCLYYILILLVALWVVGFQIFYGNEHCKLFDVLGESRMTIQQPTKKGCNPRKPDCEDNVALSRELQYCDDYNKSSHKLNHSSKCIYADMVDLVPGGPGVNSLFVPTRIDTSTQKRCDAETGTCPKMWKSVNEEKYTYVAGIEDYTMMIRSSYLRKGIRGHSFSHIGHYYECTNSEGKVIKTEPCQGTLQLKEIDCIPGLKCHRKLQAPPPLNEGGLIELGQKSKSLRSLRAGKRHSSNMLLANGDSVESSDRLDSSLGGVYAVPTGDIFTMRKLLELAGLDLDGTVDAEGKPLRQQGTAITINIEYTNMRPFGTFRNRNVGYAYRVVEQPLSEVKGEVYATHQPKEMNTRVIENRHGIIFTGKVTGSFGKFNVVYLLVMLTTSLALLGVAQKVVDFAAIYLPSRNQQHYKDAKFYVYKPNEATAAENEPTVEK